MTGSICIALWRCQFEFQLAAPQDLKKEHEIGELGIKLAFNEPLNIP